MRDQNVKHFGVPKNEILGSQGAGRRFGNGYHFPVTRLSCTSFFDL